MCTGQGLQQCLTRGFFFVACAQAVAKYNRTEAPQVLQTARKALCLSEAAGAVVHAAVYDAQLDLLLDDASAGLSEDDMEVLGELEGMLQVLRTFLRANKPSQPRKCTH